MTDKTKGVLWRAAKWAAPFLVASLGFGAQRYDASVVHQSEYKLDKAVRDTTLSQLNRRTLRMLCHINPSDSDCPLK